MGVTQGVDSVGVLAVGDQPVINRDAGEVREHPGGVHRRPTAGLAQVIQREGLSARDVDPPKSGRYPPTGLLEVGDLGAGQPLPDHLKEPFQPARPRSVAARPTSQWTPQPRNTRPSPRQPARPAGADDPADTRPTPRHRVRNRSAHRPLAGRSRWSPSRTSTPAAGPGAPSPPARSAAGRTPVAARHRLPAPGPGPAHNPGRPPGRARVRGRDPGAAQAGIPCPPLPLPGLRPIERHSDRGAGLANPSELGGFEELREFLPSRASNSSIRAINARFASPNCAFSAASCSYAAGSDTTPASSVTHPNQLAAPSDT